MSLALPSNLNVDPVVAEIGQLYSLNVIFYNEIGLPSVRVGQCLAFLFKSKLEAVELTDTVSFLL